MSILQAKGIDLKVTIAKGRDSNFGRRFQLNKGWRLAGTRKSDGCGSLAAGFRAPRVVSSGTLPRRQIGEGGAGPGSKSTGLCRSHPVKTMNACLEAGKSSFDILGLIGRIRNSTRPAGNCTSGLGCATYREGGGWNKDHGNWYGGGGGIPSTIADIAGATASSLFLCCLGGRKVAVAQGQSTRQIRRGKYKWETQQAL